METLRGSTSSTVCVDHLHIFFSRSLASSMYTHARAHTHPREPIRVLRTCFKNERRRGRAMCQLQATLWWDIVASPNLW